MADGREWIGGDKCYRKEEIEKARLNAQHVGRGWELEGVQKWSRRWIQGFLRDLGQDHIVSYLINPALQTMVIRAEHEKCLTASAVSAVRPRPSPKHTLVSSPGSPFYIHRKPVEGYTTMHKSEYEYCVGAIQCMGTSPLPQKSLSLAIEHLHAYYVEMPGIPVTIPAFDWLVGIVCFFGLCARVCAFVCTHAHVK